MGDLGHDLLFGLFIPPVADRRDEVIALAEQADRLGLDLVGVQDHPYQPAFLETWTLLTTLAARTERIRLFPDVANLPLRPPAVLARAVATLDLLSGGRVELGLGAGAFWDAIAANGGPRRTPGESVDALEEAIAVIRALWSPGRGVRLEGAHYALRGARPGPAPAHEVGIWLGAYRPRMLELTGRLADGWIPSSAFLPPRGLAAANRAIDDAARAAGRDPAAVRRLYNVGDDLGPQDRWAEILTALAVDEGVSGFVVVVEPGDVGAVRRLADEVAPAVRAAVARARGGSG